MEMSLPALPYRHHFEGPRLIIELHEIIDSDIASVTGDELCALLVRAGVESAIVDIHVAVVTTANLHMLLRLRQVALQKGVFLLVVARHPSARKVFRITNLERTLRVTATLSRARRASRRFVGSRHTAPERASGPATPGTSPRGFVSEVRRALMGRFFNRRP